MDKDYKPVTNVLTISNLDAEANKMSDSPGPTFILYKNWTIVSPSLFCPPPNPLTQCAFAFSARTDLAAATSDRVMTPLLISTVGLGDRFGE